MQGTQNLQNQTNQRSNQLWGNYDASYNRSLNSYDEIMNNYRNFLGGGYQYGMPNNNQPGHDINISNPGGGSTGRIPIPGQPGAPTQNTPQTQAGQPQQDFGNLSDPATWMSLVGDDAKLDAFVRQGLGPKADEGLVNYYKEKVRGQPGANANEQAGSANYWREKFAADPINGGSSGGQGGQYPGSYPGAINNALSGYQNFANTGGFSPEDIQNLRERAIAPTRSIYASAQSNIDRQRALNNGYSPNYTAAQAKLARDLSQSIADSQTNANAGIAQMVQQGKLYGLAGLSGTGLAGQGQNLSAMQGQSNLYGATPGMANMTGNQALGGQGQNIQTQQDLNNLALGMINAQYNGTRIPSNFSQGLGNAGSIMSLFGAGANMFGGLGGGSGLLSSNPWNSIGFLPGGGNGNSTGADPYRDPYGTGYTDPSVPIPGSNGSPPGPRVNQNVYGNLNTGYDPYSF